MIFIQFKFCVFFCLHVYLNVQHLIIDNRAAADFFLFIKPIKQHKNSHKTFVINYNEKKQRVFVIFLGSAEGFNILRMYEQPKRKRRRKRKGEEEKRNILLANGFKPLSGLQSLDFQKVPEMWCVCGRGKKKNMLRRTLSNSFRMKRTMLKGSVKICFLVIYEFRYYANYDSCDITYVQLLCLQYCHSFFSWICS